MTMNKRIFQRLVFSMTFVLQACSPADTVTVNFTPAAPLLPPSTFMAGVAEVDITPPPGVLPRAGYATWSTVGEGFRTRLYARVFYLSDKDGDSHLIIQTDLTAGSRILHTRLGEVLSQTTDIDASRITLTATHSHSAPGQILGSQFYNKHISHQAGFAQGYFDFLVERISHAAQQAYDQQVPAVLATGQTNIWGLTRNRSIQAYVENKSVNNKSEGDERTFHSVNPTLYMVRIDQKTSTGERKPLGAFASFSIHGTALPQSETLFNADIWAYLQQDWAWHIKQKYGLKETVPVAGFEGTHGDVAPAARFGMLGYIEARRVGQAIGQQAIALYDTLESQLTDQVDIDSSIRQVNLREAPEIDGVQICDEAAVGNTLAAAPLEHTSPVIGYLPFMKQGSRRWGAEEDNCQGRKRILGFDTLQRMLEPKDSFPDYVLFQLVRINDLLMVPVPFEMTTESGRRLAESAQQGWQDTGHPLKHIMVTSLAGGYTGYITTPEEYGRQYYEGGHTLYGKDSLPYLQAHVRHLSTAMSGRSESQPRLAELPAAWQYHFDVRRFLPEAVPAQGERAQVSPPAFSHAQVNEEGHWDYHWRDVNVSQIELHRPLVSIEVRPLGSDTWQPLKIDGRPVNDEGFDIAIRVEDKDLPDGMAEYSTQWYNPVFAGEQQEYRFVVAARAGLPVFYSSAFH